MSRPATPAFDRVMRRLIRVGECDEFQGARHRRGGYGITTEAGKRKLAHRVVYEHAHGPIPDGKIVRHTCDNPPCCRIDHLILGTPAENSADMVARGRSHKPWPDDRPCPAGHVGQFTRGKAGTRTCRACRSVINARRYPDANRDPSRCKRGHEWTPENTYIRPNDGRRSCRVCQQLRGQRLL